MHKSVLLEECIKYLNINSDSIMVDCTLGYGGHSSEILKRISNGYLYAFDQDVKAVQYSTKRLSAISDRYEIIPTNFVHLNEELKRRNINQVDGILYDLGVSSPQLDEGERGFSFHQDARLDMRMDQRQSLSAYEVVNEYSYDKLVTIFRDYGEEKYAARIAKGIIDSRPITTTLELVEVIRMSVPVKYSRDKHPARKVFQAIRIEVNQELEVFANSLEQALDLLKIGGRVAVITFHSLEDRICKNIFKRVITVDDMMKDLPVIPQEYLPKYKIVKVLTPNDLELNDNPRARSAKLRVIERIG